MTKNRIVNSFPVATARYMFSNQIRPVYLKVDKNNKVFKTYISVDELFNIKPNKAFFHFETAFNPYFKLIDGILENADVTIGKKVNPQVHVSGFEFKTTVVPDSTTEKDKNRDYAPELVIRQPTIIYLAVSICLLYKRYELHDLLRPIRTVKWIDEDIIDNFEAFQDVLNNIQKEKANYQTPLVSELVWTTDNGKLAHNCIDMFVWSNFAFTKLFNTSKTKPKKVTRQVRSLVWLLRMLQDYTSRGVINPQKICDGLTFNTKNDKAFSVSGVATRELMRSEELSRPRILRNEIDDIVINGGENLIRPERRLDAQIFLEKSDLFSSVVASGCVS